MKTLTQNTLIPISLVIALGYMIFSLGDSYSQVVNNRTDILEMKKESKEFLQTLKSIEARLIRIETMLAK